MPLKVFRVGLIASQRRRGGGKANRLPPPLFWKLNLLRHRSLWPLMEPIKWKLTTRRHLERFDSTSQREGLEGSDVHPPSAPSCSPRRRKCLVDRRQMFFGIIDCLVAHGSRALLPWTSSRRTKEGTFGLRIESSLRPYRARPPVGFASI